MTLLITLFGLSIAGACIWGLASPGRMIDVIFRIWERPSGIWFAIGMRVAAGVVFILAAPDTRFPLFFRVVGYLMLIAAALIPVIGRERLTRLVRWFTELPALATRLWLSFGLAFALFIVYAALKG